jgi:hypothetical protein
MVTDARAILDRLAVHAGRAPWQPVYQAAENEFLIIGPPGCGKTTEAADIVERAVKRGRSVMFLSMTRAAAGEARKRGMPIPKQSLGTLHAICYHAFGEPQLAEAHNDEWNESNGGYELSAGRSTDQAALDGELRNATTADALHNQYQVWRAQQFPRERWGLELRTFAEARERWKAAHGYFDFTDLIERALLELPRAPGDPDVLLVDEAQDLSALEMALARKWGAAAQYFVLLGDPWQNLYSFRGASARAFVAPDLPPQRRKVLAQSYRVPRGVHALAVAWARELSDWEPIEYHPRDYDGQVHWAGLGAWAHPEPLLKHLERDAVAGRTSMILASCAYMLDPIAAILRREGVPFGNIYKPDHGSWNPLRGGTARVLAYLRPDPAVWGAEARMWTPNDLKEWLDVMPVDGLLRRGVKAQLKVWPSETANEPLDYETVVELFAPEAADDALSLGLDWFAEHAGTRHQRVLEYPLKIAKDRGAAVLRERPAITLGTIHCSPTDEPILTTDGWVPIGELDPSRHRLAGYYIGSNKLSWGGRQGAGRTKSESGFAFERSVRRYRGDLVVLETAESRTRVTPNHRVLARFADCFHEKWVVYLMRRGNWWRVGHCTSGHRPYRAGGVSGRLATEQADAGWILGIYESKQEALTAEALFQLRFGLPGLTFEANNDQRMLTSEQLHRIHSAYSGAVEYRATNALDMLGLDPNAPLYTRQAAEVRKRNMRGQFTTVAANLVPLSGYVELPTAPADFCDRSSRYPKWKPVHRIATVWRESFEGDVYGLDVPPYHHYISGGAVVHNSVKGGEAQRVYLWPDLSRKGCNAWLLQGAVARDAVVRQLYVALTRASESVVVLPPVDPNFAVDLTVARETALTG